MAIDKEKLIHYVEIIEEYNDQIADITASKKATLENAEADGISKKGILYVVRQRKKDRDQRAEEKEMQVEYEKAMGL